jgi:hypothetical protein
MPNKTLFHKQLIFFRQKMGSVMLLILNIVIIFELIVLKNLHSEPIRNRHISANSGKIISRIVKFNETNETSMTENDFFKIFKACVKECLKFKRTIQRDKCLASVCDIY